MHRDSDSAKAISSLKVNTRILTIFVVLFFFHEKTSNLNEKSLGKCDLKYKHSISVLFRNWFKRLACIKDKPFKSYQMGMLYFLNMQFMEGKRPMLDSAHTSYLKNTSSTRKPTPWKKPLTTITLLFLFL